jgi:hypothetical protein
MCCNLNPQAFWMLAKQVCEINTLPWRITYGKERLINPKGRKDMEAALDELLKRKLIQPFAFDFSCPIFMLNKQNEIKGGEKWMVINYEPLNVIIVKFRFPMPNEDYLLQHLIGNMIYSIVDCKSRLH